MLGERASEQEHDSWELWRVRVIGGAGGGQDLRYAVLLSSQQDALQARRFRGVRNSVRFAELARFANQLLGLFESTLEAGAPGAPRE